MSRQPFYLPFWPKKPHIGRQCSSRPLATRHISGFCWGPPTQDGWLENISIYWRWQDVIHRADGTCCHDSGSLLNVCVVIASKLAFNHTHTLHSCIAINCIHILQSLGMGILKFSFLMKEKKNWYLIGTRYQPIRRCVYSVSVLCY